LLTPGCEVCSRSAAAVMFRSFSTIAAKYRNCCSFMHLL
jgi:hypothetical protein